MVAVERLTATLGGHRSKPTLVVRSSQKRPPRTITTTPARHRSQPTRAESAGANQGGLPGLLMPWAEHLAMMEEMDGDFQVINNGLRAEYELEVWELHANRQLHCFHQVMSPAATASTTALSD